MLFKMASNFFWNLTLELKYDTSKKHICFIFKKSRHNYFFSNNLQKTQFCPNIFLKFAKKPWGHSGAFGGIWGQIGTIAKSSQIIPQNEALGKNFSKKLVIGSKKVIESKNREKKPEKVKFWFWSKVDKLYLKMKLLKWAFRKRQS